MGQTEQVSHLVKRDALDIKGRSQIAAIGIPRLRGVNHDIPFEHSRSGIAVVSHGQGVGSEAVAKKRAAKGYRVYVITGDDWRGRVHYLTELGVAHHLIPHVDCG